MHSACDYKNIGNGRYLELIPFKPEHLKGITGYWEEKYLPYESYLSYLHNIVLTRGPAWTLVNEEKVIACGGINIVWKGVGEAWLITNPKIRQYGLYFFRLLKRHLWEIIKTHELHRVQADVDRDYIVSCRMMRCLGFQEESVMRNYGPNKEVFVRYVILR